MNSSELIWSWLKIIGALPVVLLLAYVSFKFSRGYMNTLRKGQFLKVIETVPVFNKSAVSIVQVGDRYLVLGASEQGVHLLTELNEAEAMKIKKTYEDLNSNPNMASLKDKLKAPLDWRHSKK